MHRRHLLYATGLSASVGLAGCTDALEDDGDDDGPLYDGTITESETVHFTAEAGVELRLSVDHEQGDQTIVVIAEREGEESLLFEDVQTDGEWTVEIPDAGEYDLRVSTGRAEVFLEEA